MRGTFIINIELGNAGMSCQEDIIKALRGVIGCLEEGRDTGKVKDDNGNTVGDFGVMD